jgi:hypothetical protein
MSDPNFHPTVRLLEDYSRVASFRLSDSFGTPLHHPHESKRLRGRHAIVLGRVPVSPEQFQGLTSPRSRIFYSRGAAIDWLNAAPSQGKTISGARAAFLMAPPVAPAERDRG